MLRWGASGLAGTLTQGAACSTLHGLLRHAWHADLRSEVSVLELRNRWWAVGHAGRHLWCSMHASGQRGWVPGEPALSSQKEVKLLLFNLLPPIHLIRFLSEGTTNTTNTATPHTHTNTQALATRRLPPHPHLPRAAGQRGAPQGAGRVLIAGAGPGSGGHTKDSCPSCFRTCLLLEGDAKCSLDAYQRQGCLCQTASLVTCPSEQALESSRGRS